MGEGRVGAEVTVVGVPVTDTCKEVADGLVRRTIPRDTLVDARGPWIFEREALVQALDRVGTGADISNLIELCRAAGLRVRVLIPQ
jgi:2-C-methyl-D-erythritol 4-phosphate cytidylyltransferase